jgi:hypothetical protein
MAFALSGSTVTQTGTDTSFAGLNGLAGVTTIATGDGFLYSAPTLTLQINGTLTIADPSKSTVICSRMSIGGTGNYTSGTFAADGVTPLRGGSHFVAVGGSLQAPNNALGFGALDVATNGRITLIGGTYTVGFGIYYQTGAIIREYGVKVYSQRDWGGSAASARVRSWTTNIIKRNVEHYDIGFDMFLIPNEFSVKAYASEYTAQYVGSVITPGVDAKFVASALSNTDGGSDFHNWGAGWCELYNCAKGQNLNLIITSSGTAAKHCTPLFQDVNLSVTNLAGVAQQNIRFRCIDAPVSGTPTVTYTTQGNLKTWDFRTPQIYTGTTNASGQVSFSPVLCVWHNNPIVKNLRFPSSTATIRLFGYAVRQQDIQVVLGSDTAINRGVAMISATNLTLTEAQAAALTGITFVASGATSGTVTIAANATVSDLWHAWRWWKGQLANASANDNWECSGTTLSTAGWNIVVGSGVTLSKDATLDTLQSTGSFTLTGTGTVTNIKLDIPTLSQATPANLTGLTLTGTLVYNSNSAASITLTNCTIATLRNDGTGLITVSQTGSTVTNATDPQINYLDSTLSFTNCAATDTVRARRVDTQAIVLTQPIASGTTLSFKLGTLAGVNVYFERLNAAGAVITSTYTTQNRLLALGNNGSFDLTDPASIPSLTQTKAYFDTYGAAVVWGTTTQAERTVTAAVDAPSITAIAAAAAAAVDAPTAAEIRTEIETTGSDLDKTRRYAKAARLQTL